MRGSWSGVVQKSGAKDESSRSGTLTFNMTHASERGAVREKTVEWGPRIARVEKFVGSRFTLACNTSVPYGSKEAWMLTGRGH